MPSACARTRPKPAIFRAGRQTATSMAARRGCRPTARRWRRFWALPNKTTRPALLSACAPGRPQGLGKGGRPCACPRPALGGWGPDALTHFLTETGEAGRAFPPSVLYPIPFTRAALPLRPARQAGAEARDGPETRSMHFWGRRFRNAPDTIGGQPPRQPFRRAAGPSLDRHGPFGAAPQSPARLFDVRRGRCREPDPAAQRHRRSRTREPHLEGRRRRPLAGAGPRAAGRNPRPGPDRGRDGRPASGRRAGRAAAHPACRYRLRVRAGRSIPVSPLRLHA